MGSRGLAAQALRAELEACYSKSPELLASVLDRYGVHEVAGLLKQILRHLPEPLLTNKYADAFVQVGRRSRRWPLHEASRPCSRGLTLPARAGVPTLLLQLKALNLLVLVLPEPNRDTLLVGAALSLANLGAHLFSRARRAVELGHQITLAKQRGF